MARLGIQDETSRMLEDAAGDFLRQRFDPQRLRAQYQSRCAYDRGFWAELAGQGWLALRLAEDQGGSGLGVEQVAVLAQAMGRVALPDPFVACAVMPAVLASTLPTGAAGWRGIVDGLASGASVATLAWQEDPFVLDPARMATRAIRDAAGGLVLDGTKCQVVAGDWADTLLVSALLDGQPALLAVPRSAPGASLDSCLTSDGGSLALLRFNAVALPAEALLAHGAACLPALQQALDEALVATAAQLLGLAERAFEITLDYLRTRVQFGHPIGSFQAMQHMAVDVRTRLALASAACGAAIRLQASAPGSAAAREAVAAAKARASDTALLAGRFGVQAHGAIGFAAEADIGCYLKSGIRLAAWLGNGPHHRRRIAAMAETATPASGGTA